MTQLNTPYPATAYLTGLLRSRGYVATQADLALELALRLFSGHGLKDVAKELEKKYSKLSAGARKNLPGAILHFLEHKEAYLASVDAAVRFLQGRDPTLALRFVSREFLPEGPQFAAIAQMENLDPEQPDPMAWAFGSLGTQDRAKYLASLMLTDLSAVIRDGIDERFELSRYGEKLAASVPTFSSMREALEGRPTLVDRYLDDLALEFLERHQPQVVGLTVPFPGNVYGAFRIARAAKKWNAKVKVLMGGGYVNTELRELSEPRVFDYIDYICLDDGERPLLNVLECIDGKRDEKALLRTFIRKSGKVQLITGSRDHDIPHKDLCAPVYDGLAMDRYLSILEMLNPMHRIWSDGRWNKLTLAHGCYWKKCSFCDVGLDYIGRYETAPADLLVDRIVTVMNETGQSGFHFVDEAAPPQVLRALAERLIARKVVISWWGNIRFEKSFTPELAQLLARSGCVALSGGLEVASDRLLKLMKKGVTVEQVARVSKAFTDAGIMVHAYLMYGFPTQTEQETIDSLERVRQLFAAGCMQSAYWHRFSATAHSPIGLNPDDYGIKLLGEGKKVRFARNDLAFKDPTGCDHDRLGPGLRKALYNYMHGLGLEENVSTWFEGIEVPEADVASDLIETALNYGQ